MKGGGAPAQTNPDDRRSTTNPEDEAAGKRGAVIKSADMKEDMQKEAIHIAITVHTYITYPLSISMYMYTCVLDMSLFVVVAGI